MRPPSLRAARAAALLVASGALHASAQVAELDLRTTAFLEPSSASKLTVLTPLLSLAVSPTDWLSVSAGYEADIVSGATEAVKAGPLSQGVVDVVSSATSFSDERHIAHGGLRITRKNTHLAAAYSYGTESDYRSNAISVSAGTDFLQKNTQIELSYARGFDRVCTSEFAETLAPSARTALDSSQGCFSDGDERDTRDVDLDNYQVAWTQTWTPVFATQVVATGALQHGFLENPYRSVVITPTGLEALENHPDNRFRTALAVRGRYYLRPIKTAFGLGVRGYRDSWDLLSMTYELEAERYLFPWLRVLARGRFYSQTGALFWSDDYTGGEPELGPRGQYWTGDRELSPLQSYMLGGRVLASWQGRPGDRVLGAFLKLSAGFSLDVVKTNLQEFTWAGQDPDDTWVFLGSLGANAEF
ncbi:MAG TPA: DUF3570 domain-containing protein [Polyangiaceae bacterium]|nr:DUF3570 domain-containing protein [Polyangiaceae bacterium]